MTERAPDTTAPDRRFLVALLVAQAVAGVLSARARPDTLNPDAIAYVLTARHYLAGDLGLAVNGYWGPMFSWIAAIPLALGVEPILAAHLTAAACGLVFTVGTHAWLAAVVPGRTAARLGALLAAAAAVAWSADVVTPDLLLAGLLALFAARLTRSDAWTSAGAGFRAGLWLGAAYLSKAAALPTGAALVLVIAAARTWGGEGSWRDNARAVLRIGAGAALLAAPWIGALSVKYGHPTFSTTGAIAHAVVGPGDVDRWYPTFRTFHVPETGRLTSWEDPSFLEYARWSPWQDWTHFRHQTRVVGNNAWTIAGYLKDFDALGLGVASALLALVVPAPSRVSFAREHWRWGAVAAACIAAPYLFVFAYGERYYWPAYPFLLGTAFGLVRAVGGSRRAGPALIVAAFAVALFSWHVLWYPFSVPLRPSVAAAFAYREDLRVTASRDLAEALRRRGASGPIHSNVTEGLYVSFFSGLPWHGAEPDPPLERLDAVGAGIVVAKSGSPLESRLRADAAWEELPDAKRGSILSGWVRRAR